MCSLISSLIGLQRTKKKKKKEKKKGSWHYHDRRRGSEEAVDCLAMAPPENEAEFFDLSTSRWTRSSVGISGGSRGPNEV
jgi:hypothetical protein